jgi:hypothetical protein
MNWDALGRETVELGREYLTLDTTNPPGNETVGARFLERVLGRDGIASEIAESAPGRGNLVARLPGDGSEGGIVLHHHIDVVYADRRYWTMDPFGGVIQDGFLYGRGAIDMKSTGILHLAAMLAIKRAGVPLKRDLVLLATADEEAGSRFGAQWVADRHREWLAGAEYALSELGGIQAGGLRAVLLHVLDVPGPSEPLPGGSLRAARGAGRGRREGAAARAGPHRGAARLRAHGVGGARLEPARDRLLPSPGRAAEAAVDLDPAHRASAAPAGPLSAS